MWFARFGNRVLLPDLRSVPPFHGPPIPTLRHASGILEVWSGDLGKEACCDGFRVVDPIGVIQPLCLYCGSCLDCLAGERARFSAGVGLVAPSTEVADRGHLHLTVELPFLVLLRPVAWKLRRLDRMRPSFSLDRIRTGLQRLRLMDFERLATRPDICFFARRRHFPSSGMEASFHTKLRRLLALLEGFSSPREFQDHVERGGASPELLRPTEP